MSTEPSNEQKALQVLSFLHQKLLTTHFYPEEFQVADAALKFVESLAKELSAKINPPEVADVQETK